MISLAFTYVLSPNILTDINRFQVTHFPCLVCCQVMLGVDRLDMIKGIPQKILAFEKFLEENPNWRDKVVLLQIAVPTRTDVCECMFCPRNIFFSFLLHPTTLFYLSHK